MFNVRGYPSTAQVRSAGEPALVSSNGQEHWVSLRKLRCLVRTVWFWWLLQKIRKRGNGFIPFISGFLFSIRRQVQVSISLPFSLSAHLCLRPGGAIIMETDSCSLPWSLGPWSTGSLVPSSLNPWSTHPWCPGPWSPSSMVPWSPDPWSPDPWSPGPWSLVLWSLVPWVPGPWSPHPWCPGPWSSETLAQAGWDG